MYHEKPKSGRTNEMDDLRSTLTTLKTAYEITHERLDITLQCLEEITEICTVQKNVAVTQCLQRCMERLSEVPCILK